MKIIIFLFSFCVCGCTEVEVVKPSHEYYDYDTNKRIDERWQQIYKHPTKELIKQQLEDYELLRQRHNKIILENNRLANNDN